MAKNLNPTDIEIRAKTKACEERFNACLANPKLRAHQWLETAYAEFNFWSFGLKASHSDRSSLDYKVRQRVDLREIIADLLDGLDESLTQCLDLELVEQIDGDSTSVISPEKISDSPLYFNVFNIKKILNQLTRLYIAIRKSGMQLRHHKADTNFKSMLRKNVNGLEEFRSDMVEAVLAGFENWKPEDGLPKPWGNANIQLLERLAKANARRRNRIFFATEKIIKGKTPQLENEDRPAMVLHPELGSDAGEKTAKPEKNPEGMPNMGESTKESLASLLSQGESLNKSSQAPTTATTIPLNAITEQPPSKVAGTTITKATGTAQKEAYMYPSPPQWPENSKDSRIECPYCSEPLTKKHKSHEVWSGHVSGDILPYICFIEDCKTPNDLYRTSKELTKHVVSEHGKACWICDICTPDIEQPQFEIFETAQLWREHVHRAHSQVISDTDFSKLADLAMHKMVPPLQCPLCDYASLEIKPNIDPEITRHILRFSMRSLPWEVQAEANFSKERLKGGNSSASTSNSSNNRRQMESNKYLSDPNDEEMETTDYEKLQLNNLAIFRQITTSYQNHHNFYLLREINFSMYEKEIEGFGRSACELLLPILIQLRYSMEEVLAFESYENELDKDQIDVSSLKPQLSANFWEIFDRMRRLLNIASGDFKEGSALIKTKCGTDDYIQQWRGLLDHEFIPGDPNYVLQYENEDPEPPVRPIAKRAIKLKSRDDYTVGWICALPREEIVSRIMLDELHGLIEKPANDPNSYSLGSIGQHNVVIACLPLGQTGSHSVAAVTVWMISSFPRIKFVLMVGTGSGIPPKVRLGDVVVSAPTGVFPSVVQWEMGIKENDKFKRTGSLNSPPTMLLLAMKRLEAAHVKDEPQMFQYLEEIREEWPRLAPKYLRSKSLKDVLFKSQYPHVEMAREEGEEEDEEEDEEDEQDECKFCDKGMVVKRKPREARVHYGLIASGNQVIKDAMFRDQLNKDLGSQVLCIEKGAAGVMDIFPCVVIRGICDYADSHKNEQWQEHAAAVAAAYAKELLQYVQLDYQKESLW